MRFQMRRRTYFRYVVGVTFAWAMSTFEIKYACRGCPKSNFGRTTTLFTQVIRRQLHQDTEDERGATALQTTNDSRKLQVNPALLALRACLCPEGPNHSIFRPSAPDTTQFPNVFATQIQALSSAGMVCVSS